MTKLSGFKAPKHLDSAEKCKKNNNMPILT